MQKLEDKMKEFETAVSQLPNDPKKVMSQEEFNLTFLPRKKMIVTCPNKCGGHIKFYFRLGQIETSNCRCPKCQKTYTFKREVKTH